MHKLTKNVALQVLACFWKRTGRLHQALLVFALLAAAPGCAALENPVANGVPVRRLSPELLAESREGRERTPLSMLRQKPPDVYKLAAGDILGIWIEGI